MDVYVHRNELLKRRINRFSASLRNPSPHMILGEVRGKDAAEMLYAMSPEYQEAREIAEDLHYARIAKKLKPLLR